MVKKEKWFKHKTILVKIARSIICLKKEPLGKIKYTRFARGAHDC